ncbi:unnamed protein product [Prunus armeniaca]
MLKRKSKKKLGKKKKLSYNVTMESPSSARPFFEQAASGVKVQSFSSAIGGDENENGCEGNNGDLDSFAGNLENLLDAEECDQEGLGIGGDHESKHDKPDGAKGLKKRSRPSLPQTEEEIEDEAAE